MIAKYKTTALGLIALVACMACDDDEDRPDAVAIPDAVYVSDANMTGTLVVSWQPFVDGIAVTCGDAFIYSVSVLVTGSLPFAYWSGGADCNLSPGRVILEPGYYDVAIQVQPSLAKTPTFLPAVQRVQVTTGQETLVAFDLPMATFNLSWTISQQGMATTCEAVGATDFLLREIPLYAPCVSPLMSTVVPPQVASRPYTLTPRLYHHDPMIGMSYDLVELPPVEVVLDALGTDVAFHFDVP